MNKSRPSIENKIPDAASPDPTKGNEKETNRPFLEGLVATAKQN
jgi:hypothetical protein